MWNKVDGGNLDVHDVRFKYFHTYMYMFSIHAFLLEGLDLHPVLLMMHPLILQIVGEAQAEGRSNTRNRLYLKCFARAIVADNYRAVLSDTFIT